MEALGLEWNWWYKCEREVFASFEEWAEDVIGADVPYAAVAWWLGWFDAGFGSAYIFY